MKNILSVDVEEWFHPEALQHFFPFESWDIQESRIERNIEKLLKLFAEKEVQATFFVLGWVAKKHPALIKKIVAAGHEIANHSSSHRMITKLSPQEFEQDLKEAQDILQSISGEAVQGFRAPTFSVVEQTRWAWEIMVRYGIRYDSSVYPIWHDRYGIPDAPRQPYLAFQNDKASLIEFPLPTLRLFSKNFPFGGGGYLRIFPLWFTKFAIKQFNNQGNPAIIYMHPWEFDLQQPRLKLGKMQSARHYYNIKNNLKKLSQLLDTFRWTSFRNYFQESGLDEKIIKKS